MAYSWRQLSGTDVILVNANKATASFIAPDVATQESLVFELEAVTVQFQNKNITLKKQVQVMVLPKVVTADSTDMNSTSGEVELEEEQSNETNTSTNETNTTQPTVSLKSLKLTLEKTSLNIETNTTLQVIATYDDNTSKDVTDEVEWIYEDKLALDIKNNMLKTLHKDTNIFIQAKYNNKTSNQVALEIYKEISGHRLPPEPDPTINNATLLGVDTNDNGVRDDVERWVYETYKEPVEIGIMLQSSYAYQKVIVDPSKAMETKKYIDQYTSCLKYWMFSAEKNNEIYSISPFRTIEKELQIIQLNTMDRHMAHQKYLGELSGKTFSLLPISKTACDFNSTAQVQP